GGRGPGEKQGVIVHERIALYVVMRGHRTDHHGIAVVAHALELTDLAEVHDRGRCGQAHAQHGQQALPAREHLGVLARIGERTHRLIHSGRCYVVERSGDHCAPPCAGSIEPSPPPASAPGPPASVSPMCTARHTRMGLSGISMSSTPWCRTASTTALTTAGV